ncbi:MBG domain-containing protein [Secundilactobacillus mixtipabuli]|uniref:Mucus-binding protein, LPXTG-motif cell wall anchor n=1 Tax=Secundilactobacillus mixtipabuli TaxID=1435342 RepID=A0A1Z5IAL3_9LACO|nr:MBG domain-containing protein [Secundilactobacillus mixtipabuli]GAW98769.1 mucus-binding protein, LPXTG-motif cell wall anchor [Secundilactobacillus mixtipabuli]
MNKQVMQDIQKEHKKVLQDSAQVKEHYKMYKVGKIWLFAGLFTISLGAGLTFGDHVDVHAAVTEETAQKATTPTNLQDQNVVLGSKTQAQDSATEMKAVADTAETTGQSEVQPTADQSSTDAKTPATSDTQTETATANVQTTNLGDVTDQSTIDQAKAAAAQAYAQTGKAQVITAVSGAEGEPATAADPVETVSATVEDATKTYDNKTDTPATFNVKLSDNLTAPTGWFVTGNKDEYQVAAASGDIDLSNINQNAGTDDNVITLSATGLARINAVKANQDKNLVLTAADVTAGKLTISKAPVTTGSVTIQDTSKLYDNDASTDPTSYNVKLGDGLIAPTDWTANSDGTYTVTVASGDIEANIDSQEAGSYLVDLTESALQKLNTVNTNYNITADHVTPGIFKIESNTKLSIGVAKITTNASLPTTLTVSISREEVVPSDWTSGYDNTGQDDKVYNVPINYFDTNSVDKTTIGNYTVNLTATALANLNSANPDRQLATTNIKPGQISVVATNPSVTRYISNFGGGFPRSMDGKVLGDGQGVQLTLNFFSADQGNDYQNFTDIVIVPAGMTIADASTATVNGKTVTTYTKSTNPAQSFENQVKPALDNNGTNYYSDFKVTQLDNYKNRQAFAVQWGDVNTVGHTGDSFKVNIMVDPDVKDVTTVGYGDLEDENDAAILYATDDTKLTGGKYKLSYGGAYPSIQPVATALGLDNAVTLASSYAVNTDGSRNTQWAGHFTIVHYPVEDTYNLTDESGTVIGTAVTTQGKVGDTYNPSSILPLTITATNGTKYSLDESSIPTEQSFKASTATSLKDGETFLPGATYTAKYKQVINTTTNQAKVSDQTITWGAATPTSYTVTLPSGLAAPSNWTSTGNNTYTVGSSDGDLDLSNIKNQVGSYDVLLSNQGLANLAAANPGCLFDNQINGVGKLNVTARNIIVTVKDTAGKQLKDPQTVSLGTNQTVAGADAGLGTDYPTSQLNTITFNYVDNAQNTTGIKQATLVVNKADNTITQTTTYLDSSKPASTTTITAAELGGSDAGEGLALLLNMGEIGSVIGFGVTPQITFDQATPLSVYSSVKVVYNQKATATVTYVDDDNNGSVVPDTGSTLNGYIGDVLSSQVTIPENYIAASTDALPTTVTLTADDSDNLTIHLKHQLVTDESGKVTSTQTVNYVINGGDSSKTPQPKSQTITWNTVTDKVTGTSYATAQAGYAAVNTPNIAGYTPSKTTVNAEYPGAIKTSDIKDSTVTVTYTPDQSTTTITFTGLPATKTPENKTITTTTDEPYTFTGIPTIPGYTPSTTSITGIGTSTGTSITVTYKADNNSAKVTYVDDVTGKSIDTDAIEGVTDKTGDYTVVVPANYELAKNQANIVSYHITPDDTDNITVHLTHIVDHGTKTTSRVINYVIDNPGADSVPQAPKTVTQTITWHTSTDKVTGETVATADKVPAPAVAIQSIDGYTATINGKNATEVPAFFAGATNADDLKDTVVTVTYKPNTVTANVQVPSNKGNQTVTGVSGTVDNHVQVPVPDLPGYTKDKNTVPATVNPDGTITVDGPSAKTGDKGYVEYTPDAQSIKVQFVDDTGADLGSAIVISGFSDGNIDYSSAFAKEQELINQGYTPQGYISSTNKGGNNGLAGAPKTFTQYGKVPTYIVELGHVESVEVDKVTTDVPYANGYTVNFVTPNGDVVGKTTVPANPGVDNTVDVTPNIPAGYVPTPGHDKVYVNIPKGTDPTKPITVNVTTPAGKDADGKQVWIKGEVTTDVPSTNQYTVNFVTPNGDVIGKTTIVGNPGNNLDITPHLPNGYVPTPGKTGNITITKTDVPGDSKPIIFNVTTPAGQDADGIQVWTKGEVPTDNMPSANPYTVNFVTPNGKVVGTTTVVGNPGNRFNVSGNVPNGYILNGTDGDVEIPEDPTTPIKVSVTVPVVPNNGGPTTDVPSGSTDEGTGEPTDNNNETPTGDSDNNTITTGGADHNTVSGDGNNSHRISTGSSENTVGRGSSEANGGTQTGFSQQSGTVVAGRTQSNQNANTAKATTLPQTNEQNTSVWALLGLSLMSLLSLFGFKKREDEK